MRFEIGDVTSPSDLRDIVEDAEQSMGGITGQVNAAGVFQAEHMLTTRQTDPLFVLNVNVLGVLNSMQSVAGRMIERSTGWQRDGGALLEASGSVGPPGKGAGIDDGYAMPVWPVAEEIASGCDQDRTKELRQHLRVVNSTAAAHSGQLYDGLDVLARIARAKANNFGEPEYDAAQDVVVDDKTEVESEMGGGGDHPHRVLLSVAGDRWNPGPVKIGRTVKGCGRYQ